MSQTAATIIMGAAALIALPLLVRSVRQARAAADLDASAALTLGMAWLASLPIALVTISGGLTRRLDAFRELVPILPGWYPSAVHGAMVLLAALATVLLVRRLAAESVPIHAAGLLAILLWALAHLAAGLDGGRVLSLSGGVLLVCLLAATVLPRGRGAALGAGIFGVTLGVASAAVTVARPDVAFVPCRDVCSVLESSTSGVFPNENLLGLVLVAAIPFAYLGFRGRARAWFALYLALMASLTGSRTAMVAGIVTVIVLLVVRPQLDGNGRTPGRTAVAAVFLAAAVVGSVYIVRHDWDATALTNRPTLWRVASEYIHESPWFGYGPEKWTSLYESSEIPRAAQRSAHNQWMDILFATGWVGAAVLVGMLLAIIWSSGYARSAVLVTLATILMLGTTEGTWLVGTLDLLSFSLVALILTGEAAENEVSESTVELFAHARAPT